MKFKNIFKEKYRQNSLKLAEIYKPEIDGYAVSEAFILENGMDKIDGKDNNYIVLKIYMEPKDD